MPPKIRQLKASLARAGFIERKDRGKGNHTFWTHPDVPDVTVVLSGKDGADALGYQERDVRRAIAMVEPKDQAGE